MQADREFVEQYRAFVRGIATQTRRQLGVECEIDDLVAFGFTGLLEARERYVAERGIAFKSFAYYRVRGAVLDGVRKMAYLPRRAHARLRAMEAVDIESEAQQEGSAGAAPSAVPSVDGRLRAIDRILGRVAAAYTVAHATEDGEDASHLSPDVRLLRAERERAVAAAIAALPEREAFLVRGHYVEGRRFDELAAELGLSKSWACRVHGRALQRLREALATEYSPPKASERTR